MIAFKILNSLFLNSSPICDLQMDERVKINIQGKNVSTRAQYFAEYCRHLGKEAFLEYRMKKMLNI